MLPCFMFRYPLQEICCLESDVALLVKEAQGEIEQSSVRFGRHTEEQADFVVRMEIFGECYVNVTALCRIQSLHSEFVVHMRQVKAFQWPNCIYLRQVLLVD